MDTNNNINANSLIYNPYRNPYGISNKDKSTSKIYQDAEDVKDKATISKASSNKSDDKAQTSKSEKEQEQKIQQEVQKLKAIEEKVKAHERAHKAAGGQFTGAVSYTYTTGPDGRRYITGGEVPIQIVQGKTPDETIRNMEIVRRAALAPADPSPQDRAVAAQATQIEQQARIEKARQKDEEKKKDDDNKEKKDLDNTGSNVKDTSSSNNTANAIKNNNTPPTNNPDTNVSANQNPLNKKAINTYKDFSKLFEEMMQGKGLSLFA